MNVRDEQESQWRKAAGPSGRRKLCLGQSEAFFEEPAIGTPKMADQRIDEARNDDIRVTLAELDQSAIGIDPAPLPAGHHFRRAKAPFVKSRRLIFISEILGAHSQPPF